MWTGAEMMLLTFVHFSLAVFCHLASRGIDLLRPPLWRARYCLYWSCRGYYQKVRGRYWRVCRQRPPCWFPGSCQGIPYRHVWYQKKWISLSVSGCRFPSIPMAASTCFSVIADERYSTLNLNYFDTLTVYCILFEIIRILGRITRSLILTFI